MMRWAHISRSAPSRNLFVCHAMLTTGNIVLFVVTKQVTTRLPVLSALFKQHTGGLEVRWMTTSEYPLLYVFVILFASFVFVRLRVDSTFLLITESV
jgi:hypothetical protein